MRKLLFLSLLAVGSTAASATDTGHCDSKPFTLKKPVATAPVPPKVAAAQTRPVPAPTPKPKPKITVGCKQPAAK